MKYLLTLSLIFTCWPVQAGPLDEAYFEQLVYTVDQDLSDPEFPGTASYISLATQYDLKLILSDGKIGAPNIILYMSPDRTFELYYREYYYATSTSFPTRTPCNHIVGTWSVPDTRLILQSGGVDILVGDRKSVGNLPGAELQLLKNLGNAEFVGRKFDIGRNISNYPKEQHMCF